MVDAEASRAHLAGTLVLPSFFYAAIGGAVAVQIATSAVSITDDRVWAPVRLAGVALFVLVAAVQLVRFRQLNGVRLGGLASRVVLGSATPAFISYALGLGASAWAALNRMWWLAAVCAVAGGAAYALSGRRWWGRYRGDPASHSRGESAGWIAILGAVAVAGLVLLVLWRR